MKEMSFVVWQEDTQYVAQCLNVDVSSFGESIDEAIKNLKEAVTLYLDGEDVQVLDVKNILIGKEPING